MDFSLVASMIAASQGATHNAIAMSVVKQQHEMDMSLVNMLNDAVQSAPPPGQGGLVDKTA